jgi:hypothetical protein
MTNIENFTTHSATDPGLTVEEQLENLGVSLDPKPDNYLDGPEVRKRLRMVLNWWNQERAQQAENRRERIKAHEYYDGFQWDKEDAEEVEARGQQARVFNRIKPSIDWITGTEIKTRIDYRVLPRTADDAKGAEVKTKLMKYVSDVNRTPFNRSSAFKDMIISGLGWTEKGIRTQDNDEEEPLFSDYEDWRNVWHDSLSIKPDGSDARYLFRRKTVDLDIAVTMFPDRAGELKAAAINEDTFYDDEAEDDGLDLDREIAETGQEANTDTVFNRRSRVRLISCEYRLPVKRKVIKGENLGNLNGADFDPRNEGMKWLVKHNYASISPTIQMSIRHMIFTGGSVLQDKETPYKHKRFSLIPYWGLRRKKNNQPYGIVQGLMDPQDDLNKRRSKALFILSTNRAVVDDDATDDWDEFYDEMQKPDGVVRKKPGAEVTIRNEQLLANEHVMLMQQDAEMIETVSGVTDESRGVETNATSGRAVLARQEQSHVVTAGIFSNYRFSFQLEGEIELSLVEQYYDQAKTIRLVGDKGQMDFIDINQEDEETGEIENDITATKADFLIDATSYSATVRRAMFESMGEILGKLESQIAVQLLDLWVDLSDLPGKEAMVQRIRQINGQTDPEEDENDPEVQERKAAQEQAEQERSEMEKQLADLEIASKEAEVQKDEAAADEMIAKVKGILAKIENDQALTRIKRAEVQQVEERKSKESDKTVAP